MIPIQHTIATPYPVGPVHCYSAELAGELVLFDTGPPTAEAQGYLSAQLDLARLKHVIITHCHIDHYGLAHWLETEYGATIYLPFRDHLKIIHHRERLERIYALLLQLGFSAEFLDPLRDSMEDGTVFPTLPRRYRIIEEDLPPSLGITALACPGHSQSDLVLTGCNWAVSGDVLLRGIFQSPLLDVDLLSEQRFNNYAAYCATLGKLAGLRGKTILPGHRESVESVDACILFYVGKLLERSARIKLLPLSLSVAEIVNQLFPEQPERPFLTFLKASEIVFIRDFLACPEPLREVLQQIGLFQPVAELYRLAIR
jgi:2,4-dienoyl-CoA reductase (NADPH2)